MQELRKAPDYAGDGTMNARQSREKLTDLQIWNDLRKTGVNGIGTLASVTIGI